MLIELLLLFLRPLAEFAGCVFMLLAIGIGNEAVSYAVDATGWPVLILLYLGAYGGHLFGLFRESIRGRLTFDVWLAAGTLAFLMVDSFMWWQWPLQNEPTHGENWFVPAGGELNAVLLPYLHAAFWWGGHVGVGWLRRRYGIDE
ncbi:MAG: hypothetical protein ACYS0E_11065 [Planctomycetota bacterium]|jgi:hypothetical protein